MRYAPHASNVFIAICAGSKTATAGLVFGMAKVGQGVAGAAIAPASMHGVCAQRKRAHSRAAKRIAPPVGGNSVAKPRSVLPHEGNSVARVRIAGGNAALHKRRKCYVSSLILMNMPSFCRNSE